MTTSTKIFIPAVLTLTVVAFGLAKAKESKSKIAPSATVVNANNHGKNGKTKSALKEKSDSAMRIRKVRTFANYIKYKTVEELDKAASMIIVASPLQDFSSRQHITTRFPDGTVQDFYTLTEVRVNKIIKKPLDVNLEEAQEFQIIEPVGLIEEKNEEVKILDEDYQELKKGSSYLIFLQNNGSGKYSIVNMNLGKFNLDALDLEDVGDAKRPVEIDEKVKFKKNALNKYEKFLK